MATALLANCVYKFRMNCTVSCLVCFTWTDISQTSFSHSIGKIKLFCKCLVSLSHHIHTCTHAYTLYYSCSILHSAQDRNLVTQKDMPGDLPTTTILIGHLFITVGQVWWWYDSTNAKLTNISIELQHDRQLSTVTLSASLEDLCCVLMTWTSIHTHWQWRQRAGVKATTCRPLTSWHHIRALCFIQGFDAVGCDIHDKGNLLKQVREETHVGTS